jgi:hypothetical protein
MEKGNIDLVAGRKERKKKIRSEGRKESGNIDETNQTREESEPANLAKSD